MKSNDKKSTAIIVLFVVVLFLSWTAIVNEFVLLVINPRNYSEYFYLNMTLTHNYINTIYYDLELSGFSYFMIYLIFSAVDVLPGLGGIIGAMKEKNSMTRTSIIIMDVVCVLALLTRFTGWGLMKKWGWYEGARLSADMLIILGCIIALNVLIFSQQTVTHSVARAYAPTQPSRWLCHICGTENSLSNTCSRCGGSRYNASPVAYTQPTYTPPAPPAPTPTPETKSASKFDEIKAYKDLLDSGAITQGEFDKLKAEILGF